MDVVQSVSLDGRIYDLQEFSKISRLEQLPARVDFKVMRAGQQLLVSAPTNPISESKRTSQIAIAALLVLISLFVGLSVLWLSSAQAAIPAAVLSSGLGTIAVGVLLGPYTSRFSEFFLLAIVVATAAMVHLAISFPKRSLVVQQVPGVLWVLYGVSAVALLSLLAESGDHPNVWNMVIFISIALSAAAWLSIVLSAAYGVGNLDALELQRARLAMWGSVVLAGVLAFAFALFDPISSSAFAVGVALLPLPFSYALVKHQFFDARPYARTVGLHTLSTLIYVVAIAVLLFSVVNEKRESGPEAFGVILFVLLAAETVRFLVRLLASRMLPTPENRLNQLEFQFTSNLGSSASDEMIGQVASRTIMKGLGSSGVSFAVRDKNAWRIVAASGSPPAVVEELESLTEFLSMRESPVYLGPEGGERNLYGAILRGREVAVAAPLHWSDQLVGAVLISPPRDLLPYRAQEINFVQRICRHSAAAIHNANLTNELLHAERSATLDWIAAGLMHSVGRPMTIIARSTERISARLEDSSIFSEFLEDVRLASEETLQGLQQLRTYAATGRLSRTSPQPAQSVVERAVRVASRLHDGALITIRPTADLPLVLHGEELQRVIISLLDNALNATAKGDARPEVKVSSGAGRLKFEVIDFGSGMPPHILERATEAFFTTRDNLGGSGIGLLDAKSTINRIGGDFRLNSVEGQGTTATVTLSARHAIDPSTPGIEYLQ